MLAYGKFEIGRILHLKSEIPKSQVGPVRFEFSDFGFEMQDSSNFKFATPAVL
jgi:hypothetical protein